MSLRPGSMVGPYRVTQSLGAGGMGQVWRAVDSWLGREAALKVLREDVPHGTELHARFDREAKMLASLNHPNIATLYGVEHLECEDGRLAHVLVMELVPGEGLDERLARGPLPPAEAVAVAVQVAAALAAAHDRGIVHRDLKPGNVRIQPDGTAKVLDFGLAKTWQDQPAPMAADQSPTVTHHHSLAGAIVGTASCMAPEQARGLEVDHRVDVWALGCLLFEMLAGRQAFVGKTLPDILAAVLKEEPPWDLLPSDLHPSLLRVLRRCLQKDADWRYQHLADARLELLDVADSDGSVGPRPASARRRGGIRSLWAFAILAGLALALAAQTGLRGTPSRPLPTFQPLSFHSGHVGSARFAPDERTVVFGMATGDHPIALYSTRTNSIESRRLDLPPADVLDIADDGRMLILLDAHREGTWVTVGTLAEADLAGGAPRPLIERVNDGAISDDGETIAAVREAGPLQQLEFPLGRTRFVTEGWISHLSIDPDGRRVAFLHHPFYGDDRGLPMVLGPDGDPQPLAPESSNSLQGLAWSADGAAVWYTEFVFREGGVLWSVRPGEEPEALLRAPMALRLQDVAADGRVLLVAGDTRAEIAGRLAGQMSERIYEGWNDDSIGGISADGRLFAGNQQQSNAEGEYMAYVRAADGSPAARLGLGHALGMSPDGRWVSLQRMTRNRNRLTLLPTGPGLPVHLDLGGVTPVTSVASLLTCSLDGRRLAFSGREGDLGPRPYVLDLDELGLEGEVASLASLAAADGGEQGPVIDAAAAVRPVGPYGRADPTGLTGSRGAIISPDGTRVATWSPDGSVAVHPVGEGPSHVVPDARAGEVPLQWTLDGEHLLLWDRVFPARIARVRISDGRREPAFEIMPRDPAGVLYGQIILAPGGEHYVYRFRRDLNTLFLVDGIE